MTDIPKMRCPVCENPTPITEAGKIDRHCTEIENRAAAKIIEDVANALWHQGFRTLEYAMDHEDATVGMVQHALGELLKDGEK